jgi:hypothetical protein
MVVSGDEPHRLVIHDHDSIYSDSVDRTITGMGLRVVKTPVRSPQANAFCERVIGTIRRKCLDWMIPLNERHLRWVLQQWVEHYNRGRPHESLGPGIPAPSHDWCAPASSGHRIPEGHRILANAILGGLHHEYRLERIAARATSNGRREFLRGTRELRISTTIWDRLFGTFQPTNEPATDYVFWSTIRSYWMKLTCSRARRAERGIPANLMLQHPSPIDAVDPNVVMWTLFSCFPEPAAAYAGIG